jgi:PmbA protein
MATAGRGSVAVSGTGVLGPDALLGPLRAALRDAPTDECEIWVHRRRAAVTRYARSQIHQNAASDEIHVHARAVVGGALGTVTTNALEPDALRRALGDAAALARHLPSNAEWPGLAEPIEIPPPRSFDEATAAADPEAQARLIARVVASVGPIGLRVAGTQQLELTEDAVANTRGVAAYAPATLAYLRALVQSESGSGFAEDLASAVGALDAEGVAERAVRKCELDRDRTMLEPGDYEAVFEELAVAEILRVISLTGLGAQSVREGHSFMAGRIGEQVAGPAFTLHDDALDPRTLAVPFDPEGTPKQRVALVERGVARGPVYDRTSAAQMGTRSTGHAADPGRYARGGHAGNLSMEGGTATLDQLIGAVGRGVLITRFHYTNIPDPRRAAMTGTSRDGTFLIEDGRIVRALANVRYTMSGLDLFSGIELLGPQRLARDWWTSNGMGSVVCLCPPMKVARATITGSSPG